MFRYFREHYGEWFPVLREVHRTTFARQSANLWKVKESVWQGLLSSAPHDPAFALCDSMPLPACLVARAYRCRRFRGEAAFGKDTLLKQTFYGFRVHTRGSAGRASSHVCRWPRPTPTSSACCPDLVESTSGLIVGDRNYHSPRVKEELARGMGVELLAP